jgi:hypothetical protein
LGSLRTIINQTWRRLRTELQSYVALRGRANVQLASFLRDQSIEVAEIYRAQGPSGWTALKRAAGVVAGPEREEDDYFGRRFADLVHHDDPEQLALLQRLGEDNLRYESLGERERHRLQMLAYQVDGQSHQVGGAEAFFKRLLQAPAMRSELGELGEVLRRNRPVRFQALPGMEDVPLSLHAKYGIREILTAVNYYTAEKRTPFQAGVLVLEARRIELLFVTLDKSEGFHDRIAYHDYAINAEQFHWQSQNTAGPDTAAGRRYLESPANAWSFQLFIRPRKGEPYRACGPARLEHAQGAKPMSIIWKFTVPLPARFFQEFSVLRGS